jgi:NAD(P)-dependent dehydrogenase (short-subunit alcohol dehydrogenase family)
MARTIADSGFKDWKPDRLPDLTGKTYVITGGNSGLGLDAARLLGKAGANLVLACRSLDKAEAAKRELQPAMKGSIDLVRLDLADLASVRAAADEVRRKCARIDGLINNAGIMQTPKRATRDGFELQFGTNHLGHFLWTSLLIDLVEAAEGRVVVVASIAHKFGSIDFDDLQWDKGYTPTKAYFRSKLANLLFAFELDRRLQANGGKTVCIACHPGYASTNLQSTGPTGPLNLLYKFLNPLFAQPSKAGAIPLVLAAAGREAKRGAYYGPTGMADARGPVGDAAVADHALHQDSWRKLWNASERLIGEPFKLPG